MYHEKQYSNQHKFFMPFVADNMSYKEHFHTDFEMLYVIEGSIRATVNQVDYDMSEGEFALILPNQNHQYKTTKHSRCFVCIFSGDMIDAFSNITEKNVPANPIFTVDDMSIFHELSTSEEHDMRTLRSHLFYLCSQFLSHRSTEGSYPQKRTLQNMIASYVQEHYAKPLTLKEVAQDLGYNYHYLSRFFSENFSINFRTFLNQYRIHQAQALLAETKISITDIALSSGFDSIRSFNRAFLQIINMTPSNYRKHNQTLPVSNR